MGEFRHLQSKDGSGAAKQHHYPKDRRELAIGQKASQLISAGWRRARPPALGVLSPLTISAS